MKRISKAVREEAIEALLCCADHCIASDLTGYLSPGYLSIDAFSDRAESFAVAWAAFGVADDSITANDPSANDPYRALSRDARAKLEAAALLLDGWSPGDPVEVRS